ncbi:MAG TPA: bifunctional nuclease domain-containing protein [Trebonia sp.]|nr:bifunctional nuclease domain-containing protein [Trebonia sp.]
MGQPRLQTPPDAELVYAARSGLKEPMAELLRRHWSTAVLLAERVLGSPDLARDAVQEAAIAAMTDVERLRSPDRFGAWFCGIALNVSRKWLRQLRSEVPGPHADLEPAAQDPAEAAEAADTAARVRCAIGALADGQQDAVRLFYLQGLSHREVADELGISVGAVKARLHQARAALAPRLASFKTTREREAIAVTSTEAVDWTEVTVTKVLRGQRADREEPDFVMILAERDGDRTLHVWIGPAEAKMLAIALESVETPRPFAYKLASGLVEAAGSRINEVRITRLTDSIFYAVVEVESPAGPREVDARPSDAVNLAVGTGAPIRVNTELFGTAHEDGDQVTLQFQGATADIAAEERQRMAEGVTRWRAARGSGTAAE